MDDLPPGTLDSDIAEQWEGRGDQRRTAIYCECETPVFDPEHDAGCRRCGEQIDFNPKEDEVWGIESLVLTDDEDGAALWWSNDDGWGSREAATLFTLEQSNTLNLPHPQAEARWVEVGNPKEVDDGTDPR